MDHLSNSNGMDPSITMDPSAQVTRQACESQDTQDPQIRPWCGEHNLSQEYAQDTL